MRVYETRLTIARRPDVKFFCDIDYDPFIYMQENEKVYGTFWAIVAAGGASEHCSRLHHLLVRVGAYYSYAMGLGER